jgi:AcrR family transcriptional regulator
VTEIIAYPVNAVRRRARGRPCAGGRDVLDEQELLGAAFALFSEKGYEATTIRELSRRIGVSHNLLNVRFGRKEDLWRAAVDWRFSVASRPVEVVFDSDLPAERRLRDLVDRFCDWAVINSDIVAITQQEAFVESWRIDYIFSQFTGPFQARLDSLLGEVREERALADLTSGALLSLLVHGVGLFFAAGPMRRRLEDRRTAGGPSDAAQARRFAEFINHGLFTRDG